MRRALTCLLIAIVALGVLAVVGVQVALWSDLPRRIVVSQLERTLGLRVQIDRFSTGWLGDTHLEGLRVGLPLEDKPILEAAVVEVDHASLLWLAVTGDLGLERIEVDRPRVHARQNETGTWNLQQAAAILRAHLDGGGTGQAAGPPALPEVVVRDAAIRVTRAGSSDITLGPIQVRGGPEGDLGYRFSIEAPRLGEVQGRFAAAEPWLHEVSFTLDVGPALLASITGDAPAVAAIGRWRGALSSGVLSGTLDLARASLGASWISGPIDARFATDTHRLTAHPRGVALHLGLGEPIRVTGGEVVYPLGEPAVMNDVTLVGLGADAIVTGSLDPQRQTGELTVTWRDSRRGDAPDYRGRASLSVARGISGRRAVQLDLTAHGRTRWGDLDAAVTAEASGPDWDTLAGRVVFDRLGVKSNRGGVRLDGMVGRFRFADRRVRLISLRLPPNDDPRHLAARGFYDLARGRWELEASAESLRLPWVPGLAGLPGGVSLGRVAIDASGAADRATLDSLTLRSGGIELEAAGAYVYRDPQPLSLGVMLTQIPIRGGDAAVPTLTADHLSGVLKVRGVVSPLNLGASGELTARSLRFRGEALGDIVMRLDASVDPGRAHLVAEAPRWLGGKWRVEGGWDRRAGRAHVELAGQDLDLGLVRQAFEVPAQIQGLARIAMTLDVPQAEPGRFVATGAFGATGVVVAAAGARVEADHIDGRLRLDRDSLRLEDIRATHDGSTIDATVVVSLAGSPTIRADAALHDWPIAAPAAEAVALMTGDIEVHTAPAPPGSRGGSGLAGSAQLEARLRARGRDVGRLTIDAAATPDRLTLHALGGDLLGGTIRGEGIIDLDRLMGSDLAITWQGVQPALLTPWLTPLEQVGGAISGSITARPTRDPRALGPLEIVMDLDAHGANVHGLALGDGEATAYTDGDRFVLKSLELAAAGGELDLWGRLSPHPGGYYLYARAAISGIDLHTLTRALAPQLDIVGQLDAELAVSSPLADWRVAFGRGRIDLRDSDFADVPLFGALFDLVNLKIGGRRPDGRGRGVLRIEEGRVILDRLRYQNRGTQITLAPLRIADIWAGEDSPISGTATVTQNLLPEVEFLGSVNQALSVLQSNLIAARIDGTLAQPRVVVQPLSALTGELTDLVTGGARGDNDPSPQLPRGGSAGPPGPNP